MPVIEQSRPQPTPLPCIAHSTWAGAAGAAGELTQLSVWRQTLVPGAATPRPVAATRQLQSPTAGFPRRLAANATRIQVPARTAGKTIARYAATSPAQR